LKIVIFFSTLFPFEAVAFIVTVFLPTRSTGLAKDQLDFGSMVFIDVSNFSTLVVTVNLDNDVF